MAVGYWLAIFSQSALKRATPEVVNGWSIIWVNTLYGMVDMAGNRDVTNRAHRHFSTQLKFSSLVGITHQQQFSNKGYDGIQPEFFFAPSYMVVAQKKFGAGLQNEEMLKFWTGFIIFSRTFLEIKTIRGTKDNIIQFFNLFSLNLLELTLFPIN